MAPKTANPRNWRLAPSWEYQFHFAAGIRLVDDEIEQDEDVTPLVEIKGTFCAKYESPEKLTQEQIEVFSEKKCWL
ncbi:hypothetical protein [Vibrio algivorus]|uniref:Uncharacterized protein n=1 Tax=Vibrio algivorus TaxID=1667024 RepID=A0ABQ6ELM0_9VIBR|nr:hypothetical protein [Vibrio algivorus]GLT13881.1 hypothetical protein GCM10007931_08550 [Vibrio algivorus]